MNKTHIFDYKGDLRGAYTLCGMRDRDGIIFESSKLVTCKKCLKKKKKRKNHG